MEDSISKDIINYKEYFDKGVSYAQYQENFQAEIAMGDKSRFAKYLPQNWSRQSRMDRKLSLREDLVATIKEIKKPLHWLVITEHWCGDASQINPIIQKVALESGGKIDLKFVYRDEDVRLINAHLTDGRSKSIPILLHMDADFKVLGIYGPRPAVAQKIVMDILAEGGDYNLDLHTWYARDKQQSIQDDLMDLIKE